MYSKMGSACCNINIDSVHECYVVWYTHQNSKLPSNSIKDKFTGHVVLQMFYFFLLKDKFTNYRPCCSKNVGVSHTNEKNIKNNWIKGIGDVNGSSAGSGSWSTPKSSKSLCWLWVRLGHASCYISHLIFVSTDVWLHCPYTIDKRIHYLNS